MTKANEFQPALPLRGVTAIFCGKRTFPSIWGVLHFPSARLQASAAFLDRLFSGRFAANPPRGACAPPVRAKTSQRQEAFGFVGLLRANMLYLRPIAIAKAIEPQAVLAGIDKLHKLGFDASHCGSVGNAFENRILHALSVVDAMTRHPPQPFSPCRVFRVHVVCDNRQHVNASLPQKRRVAVQISPNAAGKQERLHVGNKPPRNLLL